MSNPDTGILARRDFYRQIAADLTLVCESADAAALGRLRGAFQLPLDAAQVRAHVLRRLDALPGRMPGDESVSLDDARLFLARHHGFDSWPEFEASLMQPPAAGAPHGLSTSPPFYRINRHENWIEPRPPVPPRDWDEIFAVMREHGITGLRSGRITDELLARLAQLDFVTSVHLEGSRFVSDAGLHHLARMPQLQRLNLTGCGFTDAGLTVLRQLPALREFYLYHHHSVTDAGLAHLDGCPHLERVDLLGSTAGDGVLRALAGKPHLRHFKSGDLVTGAGLQILHEFPHFKTWQGREPEFTLMGFDAEPNYLLLRGQITDHDMARLTGLDGLFALNLDSSRLDIGTAGLHHLARLPNLGWLGFDASDATMPAIAALPRLRMLMCQDTKAGDDGFTDLSRSATLEYLWGRRCYSLGGRGFQALAKAPSLRGLSVSCKNVDDASLALLPHFPSLVEFMPMDVPDAGFRHIAQCPRLEALWCMYCRDTTDAATEHIAALPNLRTYYAGATRITDRSLDILSRISTLERITLSACTGVSNTGVAALAALPRLRELTLEVMPNVTRAAVAAFPPHVRVAFEI